MSKSQKSNLLPPSYHNSCTFLWCRLYTRNEWVIYGPLAYDILTQAKENPPGALECASKLATVSHSWSSEKQLAGRPQRQGTTKTRCAAPTSCSCSQAPGPPEVSLSNMRICWMVSRTSQLFDRHSMSQLMASQLEDGNSQLQFSTGRASSKFSCLNWLHGSRATNANSPSPIPKRHCITVTNPSTAGGCQTIDLLRIRN